MPYMVDNGVIGDPLMKEWEQFEQKLFQRLYAPNHISLITSLETLERIKIITDEYFLLRRTMYNILDQLNDPFFVNAENDTFNITSLNTKSGVRSE